MAKNFSPKMSHFVFQSRTTIKATFTVLNYDADSLHSYLKHLFVGALFSEGSVVVHTDQHWGQTEGVGGADALLVYTTVGCFPQSLFPLCQ